MRATWSNAAVRFLLKPCHMKTVFAGTSEFAVPSLRAVASEHDVTLVVTRPDRPKGRGRSLAASPVKGVALELGLEIFQPANVNSPDSLSRIRETAPDVAVVVSYGQMMGAELLRLPAKGCYNLHASLLPKYRGAAPVEWAVINGEVETGVTVIRMNEKMDAGLIAARKSTSIGEGENAGQLKSRLAEMGAGLLLDVLKELERDSIELQGQDESKATLAGKLEKRNGLLDWSLPARRLADFVRGVTPWPGAFTFLSAGSKPGRPLRLILQDVAPVELDAGSADPGEIVSVRPDLIVAAGSGAVRVGSIQAAGRKPMSADAFLRGHEVQPGDRLGELS